VLDRLFLPLNPLSRAERRPMEMQVLVAVAADCQHFEGTSMDEH
jgi:hypothetical protein